MNATTWPLAAPLVMLRGTNSTRVSTVLIRQLCHADRVAVEQAIGSSADTTTSNCAWLQQLTGLPADAVKALSYRDMDDLLGVFVKQTPQTMVLDDSIVPAGTVYVLQQPLATPVGNVDQVTLRELRCCDQEDAERHSKLLAAQQGFLIAAMTGLALEDVDQLSLYDSLQLTAFFRRVIDTPPGSAQDASGAVPDTPGADNVGHPSNDAGGLLGDNPGG